MHPGSYLAEWSEGEEEEVPRKRQRRRQQRPPVTVDSVIVPEPRVSPRRSAAQAMAAKNLQKQGQQMQRMARKAQGGYETLPLGLVIRHRVDANDRAKTDPPTMFAVVVKQAGAHVYTIATNAGVLEKNIQKTYLTVPSPEVTPSSVGLDGVLEAFNARQLTKTLSLREFARANSMVGGAGHVKCSCGKAGKCTGCKCAKAGRFCGSSCGCSKYSACQNKA